MWCYTNRPRAKYVQIPRCHLGSRRKGRALCGIRSYPRQLTYARTSHLFNAPSAAHYDSPIAAGISPPPALCKLALCLYFRFFGLEEPFSFLYGAHFIGGENGVNPLFPKFRKNFFECLFPKTKVSEPIVGEKRRGKGKTPFSFLPEYYGIPRRLARFLLNTLSVTAKMRPARRAGSGSEPERKSER